MKPIRSLSLCALALVCASGLVGCNKADNKAPGTSSSVPGSMKEGASKAGQAIDDMSVTTKVKAQLAADKEVSGSQISVTTNQGKVTLTGSVPAARIARVEQIVRGVEGVREVDNQLKPTSS